MGISFINKQYNNTFILNNTLDFNGFNKFTHNNP